MRLRFRMLVVVAALMLGATTGVTSSAAPKMPSRPSAVVQADAPAHWIQSTQTGKCLTVPNGTAEAGVGLIQWTCDPDAVDQQWWFDYNPVIGRVRLMNRASGQCVALPDNGNAGNGAQLIQWPCISNTDHYWGTAAAAGGGFSATNLASNLQIGLGAGSGDGVPVVQNPGCGCADQKWRTLDL